MYRAQEFAYAERGYSRWVWSDWYRTSIDIKVGDSQVYVDSQSPQLYVITGNERHFVDNDGAQNISWNVIDQDYDRGTLRIREQKNGVMQMYIEFNNVKWVYSSIQQIY